MFHYGRGVLAQVDRLTNLDAKKVFRILAGGPVHLRLNSVDGPLGAASLQGERLLPHANHSAMAAVSFMHLNSAKVRVVVSAATRTCPSARFMLAGLANTQRLRRVTATQTSAWPFELPLNLVKIIFHSR